MPRRYPEARKWYGTKEWRAIRKVTLQEHPFCVRCEIKRSTIVDHVIPHRGSRELFFGIDGCNRFQGLCDDCHNRFKKNQEFGKIDTACDDDGYPSDPRHPWRN